ncbi:MAG: hypothetical protein MUD08_08935 [Cytophagales bacterium]|jgi:hypothetical protein|nr:hypothetical protein [Cytophagales bacterium]
MKNLPLIFLLATTFACRDQAIDPEAHLRASACGTVNSIEEVPWLKEKLAETCSPSRVIQGNYQGQIVYMVQPDGMLCCFSPFNIYNCRGERFEIGSVKYSEITDQKVIWEKN